MQLVIDILNNKTKQHKYVINAYWIMHWLNMKRIWLFLMKDTFCIIIRDWHDVKQTAKCKRIVGAILE